MYLQKITMTWNDAKAIQDEHLAAWKSVLNDTAYAILVDKLLAKTFSVAYPDAQMSITQIGDFVPRGVDLDRIVYAIRDKTLD